MDSRGLLSCRSGLELVDARLAVANVAMDVDARASSLSTPSFSFFSGGILDLDVLALLLGKFCFNELTELRMDAFPARSASST